MKKPLEDYIDNIKNFLRKGDFSNALNIINDALTDYPSNPKLYINGGNIYKINGCLLYTSPSPRDVEESRMPSSA